MRDLIISQHETYTDRSYANLGIVLTVQIDILFFTFNLIQDRTSHRRCSVKRVFLENSQNSQENTCSRDSFLIKACKFIKKESLAKVFSCKFCEISKNTFFYIYRTPPVAASKKYEKYLLRNICKEICTKNQTVSRSLYK